MTEQSSLDDFLATAELAGTEFVAGRCHDVTISLLSMSKLISNAVIKIMSGKRSKH